MAVIHAVSGYISVADVSGCGDPVFDHYLLKPVPLDVLLSTAEAAFKKVDRWRDRLDRMSPMVS